MPGASQSENQDRNGVINETKMARYRAPLICLETAAKQLAIAASGRTITVGTLRREIRAGNLTAHEIGRKNYVTQKDLEEYIARCRKPARQPAFSYERERGGNQSTSSETENMKKALDSALKNPTRPKRH